jgi:hypothetical protein
MKFPEHKCGLYLEHNVCRDIYQSVRDYDIDQEGHRHYEWISDAERDKAYESNEMWTLQWYPDTPIGSYCFAASALEALLEYCNE